MVDWHSAIWNLLAGGHSANEIIESLSDLTEDFIKEIEVEMKGEENASKHLQDYPLGL